MGHAGDLLTSLYSVDAEYNSSRMNTLPEYMTKITMATANAKYSRHRHGVFFCKKEEENFKIFQFLFKPIC